jgi:hypothetical protein
MVLSSNNSILAPIQSQLMTAYAALYSLIFVPVISIFLYPSLFFPITQGKGIFIHCIHIRTVSVGGNNSNYSLLIKLYLIRFL